MPTLIFYPDADPETSSVDGYVAHSEAAGLTWAALIAAAGNQATDTSSDEPGFSITAHADTGKWLRNARGIWLFDTSSLPATATIISATLSLFSSDKADNLNILPNINIYSANPASNIALVGTDYPSVGSIAYCDTPISFVNLAVSGGQNDFILNATGIAAIGKGTGGMTKISTRNANYDVAGVAPAWSDPGVGLRHSMVNFISADISDPTIRPILTILAFPCSQAYIID